MNSKHLHQRKIVDSERWNSPVCSRSSAQAVVKYLDPVRKHVSASFSPKEIVHLLNGPIKSNYFILFPWGFPWESCMFYSDDGKFSWFFPFSLLPQKKTPGRSFQDYFVLSGKSKISLTFSLLQNDSIKESQHSINCESPDASVVMMFDFEAIRTVRIVLEI